MTKKLLTILCAATSMFLFGANQTRELPDSVKRLTGVKQINAIADLQSQGKLEELFAYGEIIKTAKKIGHTQKEAWGYLLIAQYYSNQTNLDSLDYYIYRAVSLYKSLPDRSNEVCTAFNMHSRAYAQDGKFKRALSIAKELNKYAIESKDDYNIANAYHNYGYIYQAMGRTEEAYKNYERAIYHYPEDQIRLLIPKIEAYNYYIQSLVNMKMYEKTKSQLYKWGKLLAQFDQQKVGTDLESIDLTYSYYEYYCHWAEAYVRDNEEEKYNEAIQQLLILEPSIHPYIHKNRITAEINYWEKKDHPQNTLSLIRKKNEILEQFGDTLGIEYKNGVKNEAIYLYQTGQYKASAEGYLQYATMEKALYQKETAQALDSLRVEYEVNIKGLEVDKERYTRFLWMAAFLIIFAIGLVLFYRYLRLQAQSKLVQRSLEVAMRTISENKPYLNEDVASIILMEREMLSKEDSSDFIEDSKTTNNKKEFERLHKEFH